MSPRSKNVLAWLLPCLGAVALLVAMLVALKLLVQENQAKHAKTVPASVVTSSHSVESDRTIELHSPYAAKAHVYKGQLHTHSSKSFDGHTPPKVLMRVYRDHGYNFVSITDHDVNTPDPGVKGILFIPGIEDKRDCHHENRIDATTPAPGKHNPQDVIDQAKREGSFVQINHPDWPGSYPKDPCWSDSQLLAAHDYNAIEVWNASCPAKNNEYERRIDMLLSNGRKFWLTSVDDCHNEFAAYCMTSYVEVFADALTVPDIMAGLKGGDFYAGNGAYLSKITTSGNVVTVTAPKPGKFEFITNGGAIRETVVHAKKASYTATGWEKYIRVRFTQDGSGRMAWTNPIFVSLSITAPGSD